MEIKNVILNNNLFRYSVYKNQSTDQYAVFLLGALQDIESVDKLSKSFSEHINCLTLEIPGTGNTSLLEASVTIRDQAKMFRDFLENYKIDKIHIIAFSYATSIAVELCDFWPNILSLSFFGGVPGIPSSGREATKRVLASATINAGTFAKVFTEVLTSQNPEIPRSKAIKKASEISISHFDSNRIDIFYENTIRLLSYSCRHLDNINVPCTICVGEYDPYVTVETAYLFAKSLKNSHFIVIENADHLGHLEQPRKVISAMIAWSSTYVAAEKLLNNKE